MTTADEVIRAWGEIANLYDPTEGDSAADALLRNPLEHAETVEGALNHIRMLDRHEGNLLGPMDYKFCLDRRLWRHGLEAVLQARVLQQVLVWGNRSPADQAALRGIVLRLTFDTNYCYAPPLIRQHRDINFVVMPFVYQELLLLPAAALAELHASRSDGDCWHLLTTPVSRLSDDAPPPRSFRKLVARMITNNAFDPNIDRENPVALLSRASPWFKGVDDDAPEPEDIVTVLGYSGQDFALAHEIGHRISKDGGDEEGDLQAEMAADLAGFRLFAASWGWRDEVLDGCPLQSTARILLGPIWFFFSASLLVVLRQELLNRVATTLDCFNTDFLGGTKDEAHASALTSRWRQVRLTLNAFGEEVLKSGGAFTEQDVARIANLVEAIDDLTSRVGGWLNSMPDQDLLNAVRLVHPDAAIKLRTELPPVS